MSDDQKCPICHNIHKHINFWDPDLYVCDRCSFCWEIKDIRTLRKKKLKRLNSFWLRLKNFNK